MNLTRSIMQRMLFDTLERGIVKGTLHLTTPEGLTRSFTGPQTGSEAQWQIHDWQVVKMLASRGDIGLGEAYADGMWDTNDLEALFRVFLDNLDDLDRMANGSALSQAWFRMLNHIIRRNSVKGSVQNIRSHYDVGNEFYKLWLDRSMTYSSAIYKEGAATLEDAQARKYGRILDRVGTHRERVLEIGCGWGGFAEAAADKGHALTGLTVSNEQHDFAAKRLNNKADIRLQDYRHVEGKFDGIVSIEMFEAVGQRYWPSYFSTLKDRLSEDGVAVVQSITIKDDAFDDYAKRSDYIRHYVFPGGILPSGATFKKAAEKAGLVCRDVYDFGQDYAQTLREWLTRFDASESRIRALGYDNAFIRSWRLYMSMCAASFAVERTSVMQVELAHA